MPAFRGGGERASVDQKAGPLFSLPGIEGYATVTSRGCARSFWRHLKRILHFCSYWGLTPITKNLPMTLQLMEAHL